MNIFAALLTLILPAPQQSHLDLLGVENVLFLINEAQTPTELRELMGNLPPLDSAEFAECSRAIANRLAELNTLAVAA